ncbi:MAG: NUDIX domain-containing protein, partial [Minisyncoccia bacterium]
DKNDNFLTYKERNNRSQDDIIRIAGIWIENEKGEVLIAQRSLNKKNDPGKWGPAAAGTLEPGETYLSNIVKETFEEIGISLRESDVVFLGSALEETSHKYFVGTFYTEINSDSEFILQDDEVENVKWVSWSDLETDIVDNPDKYLISSGRGIMKRIVDWKKA